MHDLEATIGYTFSDRALLRLALTHRSAVPVGVKHGKAKEPPLTNERLEFLGDAILAYVTADCLYREYPQLSEGELTATRAALVQATTLARFARTLGLGEHLIMGRGEEMTGGRDRDPLLAAAFEALIGALSLDQGFAAAAQLVRQLTQPEARLIVEERRFKDEKSLLQERVQGELAQTPTYHVIATEGPAHQRTYTVEVRINGVAMGSGTGPNKQAAQRAAARVAMENGGWNANETDSSLSSDV
ncbi:MAG: ribonuclease III [Ktedonobacterales bacterium]|nr:ribonuclease III [Ktedonobacterales bacterium]